MSEGSGGRGGENGGPGGEGASALFDYLRYGVAAVAASWGLMQILLVVDPFTATLFKSFWIIASALLALFFGVWFGATRRAAYAVIALAALLVTGLVASGKLEPFALSDIFRARLPLLGDALNERDQKFWLTFVGVLGMVIGLFAFLTLCVRNWVQRHITAPMLVAVLVVSAFAFMLSLGRARDIERRDIALEELRQAGMGFNIDSLQNALFFLNDRGVKLYREAGFQPDDILLALGRTSRDFSVQQQLLFTILDRAEEDAANRARRRARLDDRGRATRFATMVRTALLPAEGEDDPTANGFLEPFRRYDNRSVPCVTPSLPLMSYVVEGGALAVAASLWGEGGGAPFLYGFDTDFQERAESLRRVRAEAEAETAAGGANVETERQALCADRALSPQQAHLRAVVDPLFGMIAGRAARREPIGPQDADAVCAIAAGMNSKGQRPLSFVRDALAGVLSGVDAKRFPQCREFLTSPPPRDPRPAPAAFAAEERRGVIIRRADQDACEVRVSTLQPDPAGVASYYEQSWVADGDPGREIAMTEIKGKFGDEPMVGVMQLRGEGLREARVIHGVEKEGDLLTLYASDWTALPEAEDARWVLSGEDELVVLESELLGARRRYRDLFEVEDDNVALLRRPRTADEAAAETGDGGAGAGGSEPGSGESASNGRAAAKPETRVQFAGALSTDSQPQALRLAQRVRANERIGLNVGVRQAALDMCLMIRGAGADGQTVDLASRFVRRGEAGGMTLPILPRDEEVTVFAWAAGAASGERIGLLVEAIEPQSEQAQCAPDLEAAKTLEPTPIAPGVVFESDVAPGRTEQFCPMTLAELADVSLSMTELTADVDIEVLHAASAEAEFLPVASSVASGAEDEHVTGLMQPGLYMMRVYSADEQPSAFRLSIDGVEAGADIVDAYPPNALSSAYDLGELPLGAAPVEVNDVMFGGEGDYFQVALARQALLETRLDNLSSDLDITILSLDGDKLGESLRLEKEPERALTPVGPGRYAVLVAPASGAGASRYHLSVAARELLREDFGELAADAPQTRRETLSPERPMAVYDFHLAETRSLHLALGGLTTDADVKLKTADGQEVGSGDNAGVDPEAIDSLLLAGAYRVEVLLYAEDAGTPFELTLSSLAAPNLEDNYPANTQADAHDLGALTVGGDPVVVSDVVFALEGAEDWFVVTATEDALLETKLDGLDADVDVHLLDAGGNVLAEGLKLEVEAESLTTVIAPGRYYVKVTPAAAAGLSRYTLTLLARPLKREDLGLLAAGAVVARTGALTQAEPVAYYDFTLDADATVVIGLSGVTLDADLDLLDAAGQVVGSSANGGTDPESIEAPLAAGAYRAQVKLYDGEGTPFRIEVTRR